MTILLGAFLQTAEAETRCAAGAFLVFRALLGGRPKRATRFSGWQVAPGRIYFSALHRSDKGESMSVAAGSTETEIKNDATPAQQDDEPMVLLTDKAAEKIKEIRGEENIEEGYALRLKVQGGGCSGFSYDLYFDQPQETDRPFELKGVKLICDEMSLMYLLGTEVDYVEGLHGAGFKFNNPNVKSTCGCGSSFSV
jgi:iron-sulfur cluster assembly accessory protein